MSATVHHDADHEIGREEHHEAAHEGHFLERNWSWLVIAFGVFFVLCVDLLNGNT